MIVSTSAKTFEFLVLSLLLLAIVAQTIASKTIIEITMIISTREKAHNTPILNSFPRSPCRFPVQPFRLPENDIRGWHSVEGWGCRLALPLIKEKR
ncbi:MAG: hypothetical protein LBQ59_03975 [Candidatus Peribacteria bacterium]|nr:hypothetical protein [Candidatus Peribacteria bacterium]